MKVFLHILRYSAELVAFTLGAVVFCGFCVYLCSRLFAKLMGHRSVKIFDLTAVIGTPVHELGHAIMCLLFGHKIKRIQLWSPHAENGVYGYVEHSYNRKNPWATFGNLFISVGPIFSGLGVVALSLWLCFPNQWAEYLAFSRALVNGQELSAALSGALSLLGSFPHAFLACWWKSLLGLLVMLAVSLHVTLSWQDIKSALSALQIYLLAILIFGTVTYFVGLEAQIASYLRLFHLRVLLLFSPVTVLSLIWVLIALLVRGVRLVFSWF